MYEVVDEEASGSQNSQLPPPKKETRRAQTSNPEMASDTHALEQEPGELEVHWSLSPSFSPSSSTSLPLPRYMY